MIDATAAPGNKTSHLSALMGNKGKVSAAPALRVSSRSHERHIHKLFAFERDRKRFATLKMMLSKARCNNVEAVNADFLTTDPMDEKYFRVTHMCVSVAPLPLSGPNVRTVCSTHHAVVPASSTGWTTSLSQVRVLPAPDTTEVLICGLRHQKNRKTGGKDASRNSHRSSS